MKAKWTGKSKQKVPGIGIFLPNEEVTITANQANLLIGVGTSDQGQYIIIPDPAEKKKDKEK